MHSIDLPLWAWIVFYASVVLMLVADLKMFTKHGEHEVGIGEALKMTAVWIGVALLFGLGIWLFYPDDPHEMAMEYIERLGLKDWAGHYPNEMSGGQKQRVAIARALVTKPDIILADEPTGALDSKTSVEIMDLLKELNEKEKLTIIVVTHESGVANYTNRIIHIKDGVIGQIEENRAHDSVRFGSDGPLK